MSGSGDITRLVVPTTDVAIIPNSPSASTSGCEPSDFPAATSGNIALVQRGTCPFVTKFNNAKAAGAAGVIIFNEGNDPSRTAAIEVAATPYLGIPAVMASTATAQQLLGGATARLKVDATTTPRTQYNVTADTPKGDSDRTIVVGAHMDSVAAGPGINDNGSGHGGAARDRRADGEARHAGPQPRPLRVVGRRGGRPDRLDGVRRAAVGRRA